MGVTRHIRHGLAALWLIFAATVAWAQDQIDYAEWDRIAGQIETALEEERLSVEGLDGLRESLVGWRDRFITGTDLNSERIEALRTQIDALGPPPAEGESESDEIASRREQLSQSLAEARAPQLEAEAAFVEANALIARIDSRIRDEQTDEFFRHETSPLTPTLWSEAASRLGQVAGHAEEEIAGNLDSLRERGELNDRLPIAFLLLAVALILIVRGPTWVERLVARVERASGAHGQIVFGFLVSLGGILLPLAGISLINAAAVSTGLLGPTARAIALGINLGVIAVSVGRWLGTRLFPSGSAAPTPLHLAEGDMRRGRILARVAGLLLGALLLIRVVGDTETFRGDLLGVISFPFFAGLALVLFLLGKLIRNGAPASGADAGSGYADWLRNLVGRGLQLGAVLGVIAAAIGYYSMARGILMPLALTLAVVAFLVTLHFLVQSLYGMARGLTVEDSENALIPVLVTFALSLAALPPVSLFWGVRTTDLTELWTRFRAGLRIGETTISPGDIVMVAVVFALGLMLTRLFQGVLRNSVLPRTRLDTGGRNALVSGVGYIGITLAALAGITAAGIDLSSLAIIVGALGVGIGFGLQNIVNNFVSGIILLIERPIGEGDWVEVNGQMGTVRSISVRSTVIETFDRTDLIVPNGDLISGTVTNWTRGNSIGRVIAPVGVAYGTDTRKVERILQEIAEAHPIVSVNPPPTVLFRGFGADSLDFEIRAILTDVTYVMAVHSDLNHEIAKRFAEEGIEIPFAQRDIWLRNPEALAEARLGEKASREEARDDRPRHRDDDGEGDGE
ncbi:DUF3772 domain-containing protein [Alphaproteobacteria bacterium GH1-50]|uniref:DUF3772 domain-containing protein n=1 Tax=Kangsaoukella pontilimi TaxID=2691042 RepID=A0A7C9IFM1_9RHOB|nr:DUF3772 domain-containing protein [Kangsaoukella pontilimi]MXQ07347.1 DUF3772 domain-containing protein [Kangsaoukella pontilimi]